MKKILILALFLICPQLAQAQTSRNPCFLNGKTSTNGIPSCESVSSTSPLPITGTINATSTVKATAAAPTYTEGSTQPFSSDLSGNIRTLASVSVGTYQPGGTSSNIGSVTSTSSNVALPAGSVVAVFNTGTVPVITKLGTTSGVTVTAVTGDVIQPGSWFSYSVGSNTFLAAITSSSTSSLVITGGSGLPSGAGGGSSGGGGGGVVTQPTASQLNATVVGTGTFATQVTNFPATQAVTGTFFQATQPVSGTVTANAAIANGANVAEGSTTDAPATVPTTTTAATMVSLLKSLNNTATGSIPAGTNAIGSVSPTGGSGTSCSATVTTGGTAQNLFTGQSNVQSVVIMDIDTAKTEGIWISWLGTAAPNTVDSFYIPPYSATNGAGSFSLPSGLHPTAISVYAATTGHKVSCSRS